MTRSPAGVPGGGERGRRQRPGGGEGAEGERQCPGADAVPGGGPALQVGPRAGLLLGGGGRGAAGHGALGTKASSVLSLLLPHPCRASPPPRPPAPSCPEFESGGQPVGSRRALQHSNLLQCLAQCAEVTPYLLVMEFCPMVSGRAPLCQRPSVRPSVLPCGARRRGSPSHRGRLAEPGAGALGAILPEAARGERAIPHHGGRWPLCLGPHCTLGPPGHLSGGVKTLSCEPPATTSLVSRGWDVPCEMPLGSPPPPFPAPDLLGAALGRPAP